MLGAVILAGGHGRRMGGADKASLFAHGTRFIDRLLAQLPYGTPAVAVSPHYLGLPQVCESPLYGGPVAGIAAGSTIVPEATSFVIRSGSYSTARPVDPSTQRLSAAVT